MTEKLKEAIELFHQVSFSAAEMFHKTTTHPIFKEISPQQLELIKLLSLSGASSPGHLAIVQQVHKSAISNRLKKLHDKGWVQWVETEGDRRTKLVQATPSGEKMLEKAEDVIYEHFSSLFAGIKEEDVEAFIRIFTDVRDKIQKGVNVKNEKGRETT